MTHAARACRMSLLALGCLLALGAQAGEAIKTADGKWMLSPDTDTLAPKKEGEVMIDATAAGGGKGACPDIDMVSFTMPSHGGHGGSGAPEAMKMGPCGYHVSGLTPTMTGPWLLHLHFKGATGETTADIPLKAE